MNFSIESLLNLNGNQCCKCKGKNDGRVACSCKCHKQGQQGHSTAQSAQSQRERQRTTFTPSQIKKMGEYYNKCPYLTAEARKTIGKELNLEPSQVKRRWQNMRANEKKAQGDDKQKQIKFMDTAKLGSYHPQPYLPNMQRKHSPYLLSTNTQPSPIPGYGQMKGPRQPVYSFSTNYLSYDSYKGQKIIQQQQNNKKPANFAFHGMKAQQQLILF